MRVFFGPALLVSLCMLMTGCKNYVEIQNGELPADLIPFAERFVGNYSGEFDGKPANLNLELRGNKLVANASRDLLGESCFSSITDLKSVAMKRKKKVNKRLVKASFALDKGRCESKFDGEYLHLSFDSEKNRIYAEIVETSSCIDVCRTTSWPDGSSTTHCGPECSTYFMTGKFKKD